MSGEGAGPPRRDLAGYGRRPPRFAWSGGGILAVSLVVNFEEGSELSVADGDGEGESGKAHADAAADQQFAYGMRAGVWRVLDALAAHRRRATFYMCGRAIERLPEIARAVVAAGHEPACHGWRWRSHASYGDPEAERRDLQRCIEATLKATGERPFGFFSRGNESPWTRRLLRDLGFLYASNAFDDDLPYWDRQGDGPPLLVVPYSLDTNDMRFGRPGGFVLVEDFVTYVRDAADVLMAEGEAGTPKLLNIGLHLRTIGLPGRFRALSEILHWLDGLGSRVWVAPRLDIARFWGERFPA